MEKEIWKDVIDYEGYYQVSSLGKIKSLSRTIIRNKNKTKIKQRILKPSLTGRDYLKEGGYFSIVLYKNNVRKTKKIHQLVAIAFLNHKPDGHKLVVNHINLNKLDNRVENLEIVTNRENCNLQHLKSSSQYVGVSWHKSTKKWRSRIKINGINKYLGVFNTELKAHEAYQEALKKHLST